MIEVPLRTAAWYGDHPLTLRFPSEWEVAVWGPSPLPALSSVLIRQGIADPMGSKRLSTIAGGRRQAVIIVDDITRPTPAAALLPSILEELAAGGIARDAVRLVLATGAHKLASEDHVGRKLGPLARDLRVMPHDGRSDLVDLGRSQRGTPLYVNRWVMECDVKIGVGSVYPHSEAGYSGGSKIAVPGICGIETARFLHQNLPGAGERGGSLTSAFRSDVDEIATRIGLDFVVNAVISSERQVAAVFAGDKVAAFQKAVECAVGHYAIDDEGQAAKADVVVIDTYPFDTSLQFARSKGMWPLAGNGTSSPVALAACPQGLGHHELSPLSQPTWRRVTQRLRHLRPGQLPRLGKKLGGLRRTLRRRRVPLLLLSGGVGNHDMSRIFPKGRVFGSWDALLGELRARHSGAGTRVVVYRCAPLLIRRPA